MSQLLNIPQRKPILQQVAIKVANIFETKRNRKIIGGGLVGTAAIVVATVVYRDKIRNMFRRIFSRSNSMTDSTMEADVILVHVINTLKDDSFNQEARETVALLLEKCRANVSSTTKEAVLVGEEAQTGLRVTIE